MEGNGKSLKVNTLKATIHNFSKSVPIYLRTILMSSPQFKTAWDIISLHKCNSYNSIPYYIYMDQVAILYLLEGQFLVIRLSWIMWDAMRVGMANSLRWYMKSRWVCDILSTVVALITRDTGGILSVSSHPRE